MTMLRGIEDEAIEQDDLLPGDVDLRDGVEESLSCSVARWLPS